MKDITRIIVPVDLERHTDKLVEYATYLSNRLSAQTTFLHVNESAATGDMLLGSSSFNDLDAQRKEKADQLMANLVEDNSEKCPACTGEVVKGDTVDEIVAYAKNQKADLIVIGTHGTRGLEKILLGSVAERVLKRAHCPTLIINPYK